MTLFSASDGCLLCLCSEAMEVSSKCGLWFRRAKTESTIDWTFFMLRWIYRTFINQLPGSSDIWLDVSSNLWSSYDTQCHNTDIGATGLSIPPAMQSNQRVYGTITTFGMIWPGDEMPGAVPDSEKTTVDLPPLDNGALACDRVTTTTTRRKQRDQLTRKSFFCLSSSPFMHWYWWVVTMQCSVIQ